MDNNTSIKRENYNICETAHLLMFSEVAPKEAVKVFESLLENNTCEVLYYIERDWYAGLNKDCGDWVKKIRKLAEKRLTAI